MRGKHEIKAAVIRGRIYIYIYTDERILVERRKGRKREERERAFRPSSTSLLSSRLKKKGSPEILERTKGPVEYRVVGNHPGTITALLNLRCGES